MDNKRYMGKFKRKNVRSININNGESKKKIENNDSV